MLLDPRERQRQRGTLSLQPPRQFSDKRTCHRRVRPRHVRNDENEVLGIILGDVHHLVGPRGGPVAIDRSGGNPYPDAAEILDKRQSQHDGDRPQLTDLERGHRLIRRDETRETLGIDPAIAMRDRLEREVVYARKSGGRSVRQSGKLAAVPLGQMPLGRADLLFDQIEIVEQPLRSGRNAIIRRDRRGQQVAHFHQDCFVLREPGQQAVGSASRRHPVRGGQALAVLFHPIGAEQLRSQQRFLVGEFSGRVGTTEASRDLEQPFKDCPFARLQFGISLLLENSTKGRGSLRPPSPRAFRLSGATVPRVAKRP